MEKELETFSGIVWCPLCDTEFPLDLAFILHKDCHGWSIPIEHKLEAIVMPHKLIPNLNKE